MDFSYLCEHKKIELETMSKIKEPSYIPPFTVTAKAISLVAEISSLVERYAMRLEESDGLRLRKANRIKTIHSSLAIEGNKLTEDQVSDIIDGKNVIAPLREIQEVKNAIKAYELYPKLNPFNEKDLLKAHATMMTSLTDDAGMFRQSNVGVFAGQQCVHMAPPPQRVPHLIGELFEWLRYSKDHLLIRSCVFHYEFEFIHPFSDGNGRMGRMWQTLILGKLNPIFEHLPVENMVYSNQQKYYEAITESTKCADSYPFIEFMLNEILNTLKKYQGAESISVVPNKVPNNIPNKIAELHLDFSETTWKVLSQIIINPNITSNDMSYSLGISDRMVRNHIKILREANIIQRVGSNKKGHWEIINN